MRRRRRGARRRRRGGTRRRKRGTRRRGMTKRKRGRRTRRVQQHQLMKRIRSSSLHHIHLQQTSVQVNLTLLFLMEGCGFTSG